MGGGGDCQGEGGLEVIELLTVALSSWFCSLSPRSNEISAQLVGLVCVWGDGVQVDMLTKSNVLTHCMHAPLQASTGARAAGCAWPAATTTSAWYVCGWVYAWVCDGMGPLGLITSNPLLQESMVSWATPGSWTEHNFPWFD